MKTVYIPKGETVHYESLATEHLVVHGRLHVTYGIKAQSITGSGVIDAGSINADTICVDDVESGTVVCKRLIAKRVQSPEVFASESAAVSCFLSAAYAKIQGGMSGSNTLVTLKKPDGEQMSAFARGPREELVRGVALANVKLTMRQQDTVVFHVLEAYEVITSADQAA